MNVGSLFTGIGGFDLGLERAGMRVMWQCESEPYRRQVLQKHWPDIYCYHDVRTMQKTPYVDLVCGGFPCQDLSYAGRGAGINGEQSSLWFAMLRVIGEIRPRYIIVENVPALRKRGLDVCLGGLTEIGYDAEWTTIRASDVGAPHRRERLWIVAYPSIMQRPAVIGNQPDGFLQTHGRDWPVKPNMDRGTNGLSPWLDGNWEDGIPRVAEGIPNRIARLSSLGDSLIPQIAEWIGRRIMDYERRY